MRIAQVAPLHESVPPKAYGGTERVVHFLTEELVAMGHDVTLFASGDSITSAELIAPCARSLRLDPDCRDPFAWHQIELEMLSREYDRFDFVHFHIDYLHFALSRQLGLPQLTTMHGRLDLPELAAVFQRFPDMPVVSISDAQRKPLAGANWVHTVYHGLPSDLFQFNPDPEDYFVFVGRISREKRVDRAIEIASAHGVPLKIAAKIDKADREYYEQEIAHLFDNPLVEYIGEIDESRKGEVIGRARALLFPIDWPEPFGLVMIEAMACGTPVIAMRHGSVPEVIEDGVTGYVVDDMRQAIEAAGRVDRLPRADVRRAFERGFTARRMAEDYVAVYKQVIEPSNPRLVRRSVRAA